MSYDLEFGVKINTGGGEDIFVCFATPELNHPTYNNGKIFRTATGWDFVQGKWYRYLDVEPMILCGIDRLEADPERFKELVPSSGLGPVGVAIYTLRGLVRDARGHANEWGSERWPKVPIGHIYVKW